MKIVSTAGAVLFTHETMTVKQAAEVARANLSGANLSGANLSGANLSGANLSGANLGGANLSGANLGGANLGGANLSGANLGGANLSGANLSGANLSGANLRGADLNGANLGGANLSGANLRWANLSGADLRGANLSGANLRVGQPERGQRHRVQGFSARWVAPHRVCPQLRRTANRLPPEQAGLVGKTLQGRWPERKLFRRRNRGVCRAYRLGAKIHEALQAADGAEGTEVTRSKWIALAVLAALQVGDLVSTRLALARPGVVEVGFATPLHRLAGREAVCPALRLFWCWSTEKPRRLWFVCGVYTLIVLSNLRLAI